MGAGPVKGSIDLALASVQHRADKPSWRDGDLGYSCQGERVEARYSQKRTSGRQLEALRVAQTHPQAGKRAGANPEPDSRKPGGRKPGPAEQSGDRLG